MKVRCKHCGAKGFAVVNHDGKRYWKVFFNSPGCFKCESLHGFYFLRFTSAGAEDLCHYELNRDSDFVKDFETIEMEKQYDNPRLY